MEQDSLAWRSWRALTVGRNTTFLITRGTVKQLPRKLSYLEGISVDGIPSTIYHKKPV